MPKKKAAAKKKVSRKAAKRTTSKKSAPRRSKTATSRKKAGSTAKRSSKKKTSKKSTPKNKVSNKKVSKKKVSKKKTSKKKASKKKVSKKKTSTKKKTARAGKSTVSKKGSRKKVTKKKSTKKKATRTRSSGARVSKKKTPATRASRPASKTAASRSSAARPKRKSQRANVLTGPIPGFAPYQPKRNEDYMSDEQLEHFRGILLAWKRELMEEVDRTMHHMKDDASNPPDPNDRATQETEFGLELRTRDRERKLLKKIESALDRIDDGSYGYCEETGDEIGLRRLEARPVATLCVEAQERRELAERQFRDREDYYR